jgi:hypothetical protein
MENKLSNFTRDMKQIEETLYSFTMEEYDKKEKLWHQQ